MIIQKQSFLKLLFLFALAFAHNQTFAQTSAIPRASSTQTIVQQLGTTKVTVNYSRPNLKGRTIFGTLEPYGEVWRTGADKLTDITFEKEVSVAGNTVKPGRYGLIAIPNKTEWTIILSTEPDLWGIANYNKEKDVLRFNVQVNKTKTKQETFLLTFENTGNFSTDLQIKWDDVSVQFPITINQDEEIDQAIEQAIKNGEKPYVSATIYYLNNGKDLNKALEWMNNAEAEIKDQPYVYYWKAVVESQLGKVADARANSKKSLELATKIGNTAYVRLNNALLAKLR